MAQSQSRIAKASRHTVKPRQSHVRGLTTRALNIPNPPPTQNRDANTPRDSDSAISQRHTIRASHIKTIWHILDSTINACSATRKTINQHCPDYRDCWAEAREKIARMTLTIKLDRNWSSFQLANSTPPLSVTGNVIAPFRKYAYAISAMCTGSKCTCAAMMPARTTRPSVHSLMPAVRAC